MIVEQFIAKRIALAHSGSFTKVIVGIAITAIAISMIVMILTTSIMAGFKKEISNKLFSFWGHIHITDTNISRTYEMKPITYNDTLVRDISSLKQVTYTPNDNEYQSQNVALQSKGGVKSINPYITIPGLLSTKENFYGLVLKGVNQNYEWQSINNFIIEGKPISYSKDTTSSSEILISKVMAQKMKLSTGDKVVLSFIKGDNRIKRRFEVCGVYNTGLEEYDARFALVDLQKVQEVLEWDEQTIQGYEVFLDNVQDIDIITNMIYYEKIPQNLYAESIKSKFSTLFDWLKLQDINEKVILGLMIVVSIINMMTVLMILILERAQMIGILKSLGMNNQKVRRMFLYMAGYIIGVGLLIGNIVGLGLALLQKKFSIIKLDEANYYLDTAPIDINLWTILGINIGTFIVTLFTLIIPTMLVSNITPIKVIRFN